MTNISQRVLVHPLGFLPRGGSISCRCIGPRSAEDTSAEFTRRSGMDVRVHADQVSKPVVKHTGKQKAQWLKPGLIARVRFLRGEEKLRHATVTDVRAA
jgi:hypothetical protein